MVMKMIDFVHDHGPRFPFGLQGTCKHLEVKENEHCDVRRYDVVEDKTDGDRSINKSTEYYYEDDDDIFYDNWRSELSIYKGI